MKRTCFIGGLVLLVALSSVHGQKPIRFTLQTSLFDLAHSLATPGAVPVPQSPTNLNMEIVDWSAEAVLTNHVGVFEVRFAQPTPVGSLFAYGATNVSFLSGTDWNPLPLGDEAGRTLKLVPFAAGELIDAIRLFVPAEKAAGEDGKDNYRATLPFAALIPVRMVNVAKHAIVKAGGPEVSPELTATNHSDLLVDGRVDPKRNFVTPPASSSTSSNAPWVMLQWKEPQEIRAVAVFRGSEDPGFGQTITEVFTGEGDPGEAKGTNDWRTVDGRVTLPGQFRQHQLFVTPQVMKSRALRLRGGPGVVQVGAGEILVLTDLGFSVK